MSVIAGTTTERFFDTNILVYFVELNSAKATVSEGHIRAGGVVSVQVLNEFVRVARRKLKFTWDEIRLVLQGVHATCRVVPLSVETHDLGLRLAERYNFQVFDAMIVAAALLAGCTTLYSEDMQDGMVIDGLTIRNPYAATGPA